MIKYILKRLLQMIPVLIGVMIIVFSLSYLMPGDPVLNQMPDNYTQEQYDEVREKGIHPWVGAGAVTEEQILRGYKNGGELITTNHPAEVMRILAKHGLR